MTPSLPAEEAQQWLLTQLAEVLARDGWKRFVSAPLIEPNETCFPDPYQHGPRGIRTLARRFLRHAGVTDLDVGIESHVPREDERDPELLRCTALEVVSVGDGWLELDLDDLGPPEDVVPIVSHRIALAYRRHRGLDRAATSAYREADGRLDEEDADQEDALASIVEIHLGFGILAANGAHRYRAAGRTEGRVAHTAWSHERVGGLEMGEVVFLLAVQLVVRDSSPEELTRVRRALSPNQAAALEACLEALRDRAAELRARLGLPDPSEWPPPAPIDAAPLEDDEDDDFDDAPESELERRARRASRNAGRPVFRVRRTQASLVGPLCFIGTFASLVGAVLCGFSLALPWFATPFLALGLGIGVGRRFRSDICSDPDCERGLTPSDTVCPGCGGRVAGEIAKAAHRLAAEEELEEREAQQKKARREEARREEAPREDAPREDAPRRADRS